MKTCLFACFLAVWMAIMPARADVKPEYSSVVKDLEVLDRSGNRFTLVFWMPPEFWQVAAQSSGKLTDKAVQELTSTVQPYTIVAVIDAQMGLAGAFTYAETDVMRSTVSIEDTHKNVYRPLNADQVDGGVANLIRIMRPILANAMGEMGTHMEFLVFSGTTKEGQRFADVTQDGMLTVSVGPKRASYRLPLGSFLPPAVDDKTGETFPGSYHFNPFTGNRLSGGVQPNSKSPRPESK